MSPVAAPADRRFRRAHVKPARRRRWRARVTPLAKYGLLVALTLYAVYSGASAVVHASALQIDRFTVRGNAQLSSEAVSELLAGLRGGNILLSDLGVWRGRLLASPWVKDAALRRVLPSTIEVLVQERQPIGLGRIRGGLYLVDDQGAVIEEYGPAHAKFDLPIVDGLSDSAAAGNAIPDGPRAALAARLILSLRSNPDIAGRLSQVDVSDGRNAGVILNGDPAVIYLGSDRFLERLQSYLQLEETMKERVPGIDSVDLRFDDRIYARIAGRSGKGIAASPGPTQTGAGAGPRVKSNQ